MINKKTLFCLIVSLVALGSAEVMGMVPHPTVSNVKRTSLSMITQLVSNFFIMSTKKINEKIEDTKSKLITELNSLKNDLPQSQSDPILNKVVDDKHISNIKNLWDQLNYFYVSNIFERFFNRFGPDIDELKGFTTKKLHPLVHPDKFVNHPKQTTFENLFKDFKVERRKNPCVSPEAVDFATDFIKDTSPVIVKMSTHDQSMMDNKAEIEIKKAAFNLHCTIFAQEHEISRLQKRKGF